MADWKDDLPEAAKTYLDGRRLDEVECIIPDLPGIARGKAVPASKFARQDMFHLPDSIFYQTITGNWGEAAGDEGFIEKDMILRPDMSTATAAPWTGDWTLQVIHDAFDRDGNVVEFSPRNVLKRVVDLYRASGWEPVVAPEMEFFLTARNLDPAQAIKPMMGRSGRPAAARQAYSMTAVDEFGPVIDDIYDFAEAQGSKPIEDEPGSAMHIHHSVLDMETGNNIFSTEDGAETPAFMHFIAGLQHHMPNALAVFAPYVNSYRRYVKDHAAPINLEWGRDNRTTGIRVPLSSASARRVENRLAGMDCNPYLGIAASLACGYLGLKEGLQPAPEYKGDAYDGEGDIPRTMGEALRRFNEATALHEVLGPEFARVYGIVKEAEYDEFLQVISPWEREHLLLNV